MRVTGVLGVSFLVTGRAIGVHPQDMGVIDGSLVDAAGRHQHVAVREPAGEVALRTSQQSTRMQPPTGGGQHDA